MSNNAAPRKAQHALTLTAPAVAYNAYGATETEIGVNSGAEAVSLWMRYATEFNGPAARLTPDQARTLAADLIARADEIETPAAAPSADTVAERHGAYAAELYTNLHGPSIGCGEPYGRDYREDDLEAVATWAARHALGLESYEGAGDAVARGEESGPTVAYVESLALEAAEDYSREGSLSEQDVDKWAADFARRVIAGEVSL